jgi:Flp pilus assembly protein TadG
MAPLAAVLMIFLIAMVAFAVDIGWIVLAKTNLQNTADSAALAGADPLMNGYVQYNLTSNSATKAAILTASLASARTYAKNFASYNSAGGVSSLTLNDSDIEFGFMDASNNYTPMPTYTGFPNTIKVTMRLDNTANQPLSLSVCHSFRFTRSQRTTPAISGSCRWTIATWAPALKKAGWTTACPLRTSTISWQPI